MDKFIYKNSLILVRMWDYGNLPEKMHSTCFCCNKKINDCKATLLINNYEHIPNTIMHTSCFQKWKNKTDELCDNICSAYKQWKKLDNIFGNRLN